MHPVVLGTDRADRVSLARERELVAAVEVEHGATPRARPALLELAPAPGDVLVARPTEGGDLRDQDLGDMPSEDAARGLVRVPALPLDVGVHLDDVVLGEVA